MIQASAVRPVQPHVCGGPMVVVTDGPAGHSDTRPLIAPVLFSDIELLETEMTEVNYILQRCLLS